jgi:hypothetical protein
MPQTSGYSYPRVVVIQIDVHPAGENSTNMSRFPRLVHVWSTTIRISRSPHIAIFHTVVNIFEQIHCTREEWVPTQSTARRLIDPWVRTQLLSHNSPWSNGKKSSFSWHPTTMLTGPISLTCDRYVQYLLTEGNSSVINWHRRGLQLWRCRLVTYHSSTFSTSYLHFSPKVPIQSLV